MKVPDIMNAAMSNTPTPICEPERTEMRASLVGRIINLCGVTARKSSISLIDQVVVSGVNFITTVLLGRLCGPEELAKYSLGFTLIIIIFSVQETLITTPYTIYAHRLEEAALSEYRGAVLVQWGLLSALAMLTLAVWATVTLSSLGLPGLAPVLYVLSLFIPFYLLRNFARLLAFAHLDSNAALRIDLCAATMQLGAIIILSVKGLLSVMTIYLAIGAANAVVAVTWLALFRNEFTIRRQRILPAIRHHVSFGSWSLASRIVSHLNSNILLLWLMVFVLGDTATGILAACMTIVGISNPFIIGIAQLLGPRIAQAFAESGLGEVLKVARKATIVIGLALGGFCCGALLFGENALRFIYGGLYGGHSSIITVLSISVLASTISLPAACGLLAFERPDVNLKSSVVGLLLTLAVASALVRPMGLLGVVYGLLCGEIGSSSVRWAYFFFLSQKIPRRRSNPEKG